MSYRKRLTQGRLLTKGRLGFGRQADLDTSGGEAAGGAVSRAVREDSSLLSIGLIQAGLVILVAVAVVAGQQLLAMVLMGMALLAVLGRLWAKVSAKGLTVRLRASKTRMFPGDEITLSYQVKNQKALPVLWVDIQQPLPWPVCMEPVLEESRLRKMSQEEKTMFGIGSGSGVGDLDGEKAEQTCYLFEERCSLIGGYETVAFETCWRAVRRGIYPLKNARLYTGDGFGITRYRFGFSGDSHRHFVIYPKVIPVSADKFMRNLWEGESGSRGLMEDTSVIKLTRPYQNGDSMKRMNWRMVARGQEPTVNQYEVISPRAIHFIFDGQSFCQRKSRGEGGQKEFPLLEEALSILTSLALRFADRDMDFGFSFPATDRLPAVNLLAGSGQGGWAYGGENLMGEILYRMAEYEPRGQRNPGDTAEKADGDAKTAESVFLEEELLSKGEQIGMYYYVTFHEETAAESRLLKRMVKAGRPVRALTYEMLTALKEGGADSGKRG